MKPNPLLATKLYVPQPTSDLVERAPLLEQLKGRLHSKVTLLSAPAGFGKTTLLTQWISQHKNSAAWLSLDSTDSDPTVFVQYLIAALRTVVPDIGREAMGSLYSEPMPVELICTSLVNEIAEITDTLLLVLDDYHLIENEAIHAITRFLIENSPSHFQIIIATRVDPPFPLAKWRVRNEVKEIRITDLCFNRNEISRFLSRILDLDLSDDEISVLKDRTEGWVAGLQLAALSLQNCQDISMFIKEFAGTNRHIVDYLAEEVLNQQPDHIQNFLLYTSILHQMTSELCDYLTERSDSRQILIDLDNDNLFTIPLDNTRNWFRYHHLFADLLRQRLQLMASKNIRSLHSRASKWYEKNGFIDNAIDHALSGSDYDRAAILISNLADTAWEYERKSRVFEWFEVLPQEYIHDHPNLCFFSAWVLIENGKFVEAEKNLKRVEEMISSGDESVSTGELQGKVVAMRAFMATVQVDANKMIELGQEALELLPDAASFWRASTYFTLGFGKTIQGDFYSAITAFSQAREVSRDSGNTHLYIRSNFWLVARLKYSGQLPRAIEICHELLQIVKEKGIENSIAGGAVHMMQGDLLYELNKVEDAGELMRKGFNIMEQGHDVAHKGWCYYGIMRILTAQNDLSGAKEFIDRVEQLKISSDLHRWITHLTDSWRGRVWLKTGEHDKVAIWLTENKINAKDQPRSALDELAYIIKARYLILNDGLDEALPLLDQLLQDQEKGGRVLLQIETLLIKVVGLLKQGDEKQAKQCMRQAILLAEPGGYIRVFADEGQPVIDLLKDLLEDKSLPQQFTKKLLTECKLSRHIHLENDMAGLLSEREIEVLRCIAAGLSNKKITEELFISMSTVKTHLRNINSKLGVSSRTQAVAEAKKKSLL